jgi:hypothetical protein
MAKRITPDTKLNVVLDLDPRVVDYIVSLHPHDFERLRHPLMRKFMSPRISIRRVAAMVNRPVDELLARVAELADVEIVPATATEPPAQSPNEAPDWVTQTDPEHVTVVDLLPMDRTLDADPFPPISRGIKALAVGEVLLIKHQWQPQPLYDVWSKMGTLAWYAEQIEPEEWWIWVKRLA